MPILLANLTPFDMQRTRSITYITRRKSEASATHQIRSRQQFFETNAPFLFMVAILYSQNGTIILLGGEPPRICCKVSTE